MMIQYFQLDPEESINIVFASQKYRQMTFHSFSHIETVFTPSWAYLSISITLHFFLSLSNHTSAATSLIVLLTIFTWVASALLIHSPVFHEPLYIEVLLNYWANFNKSTRRNIWCCIVVFFQFDDGFYTFLIIQLGLCYEWMCYLQHNIRVKVYKKRQNPQDFGNWYSMA